MDLPSPGNSDEGLYRPLADINVTPLVDVMLVLLIIFMITAPMLATGMKVNLPQASASQPLDPQHPILVSVSRDGALSVDDEQVDAGALVDSVRQKLDGDAQRVVQVRGDRDAPYGVVVSVMDRLAGGGIGHLAIVTDLRPAPEAAKKPEKP
ncbi:ExbD/TolR family protein [Rhodoblastus sp.]|uniref:ExbD/TolR family protein n=1 Tax=Rhodoblastus sp. TaxID=1962975 RepID=UPI003F9C4973